MVHHKIMGYDFYTFDPATEHLFQFSTKPYNTMDAKEAKRLADEANAPINDILKLIEDAAKEGKYSILVPPLSQYGLNSLWNRGFATKPIEYDKSASFYRLGGTLKQHEISWK